MAPNEAAGEVAGWPDGATSDTSSDLSWPGMDRHLDGVTMCRSVSLYAVRGWYDAEVDLAVARAERHGWDHDEAVTGAVERLRETLHTAVDKFAEMKVSAGAEGRIQ